MCTVCTLLNSFGIVDSCLLSDFVVARSLRQRAMAGCLWLSCKYILINQPLNGSKQSYGETDNNRTIVCNTSGRFRLLYRLLIHRRWIMAWWAGEPICVYIAFNMVNDTCNKLAYISLLILITIGFFQWLNC